LAIWGTIAQRSKKRRSLSSSAGKGGDITSSKLEELLRDRGGSGKMSKFNQYRSERGGKRANIELSGRDKKGALPAGEGLWLGDRLAKISSSGSARRDQRIERGCARTNDVEKRKAGGKPRVGGPN